MIILIRYDKQGIIETNKDYFPYDYYSVRFSTFADEPYTGYKKKLRSIKVDSAKANTEFATNDFVRRMYRQYTESNEKRWIRKQRIGYQLSGNCDWEEEHGIEIDVLDGKLVYLSEYAGQSPWDDHSDEEWNYAAHIYEKKNCWDIAKSQF